MKGNNNGILDSINCYIDFDSQDNWLISQNFSGVKKEHHINIDKVFANKNLD